MKTWLALAAIVVIVLGAGIAWIVIANRSIDRRLAAVRVNPDPGLDQPGYAATAGTAGAENTKPTEPLPAAEGPHPSASAAASPMPDATSGRVNDRRAVAPSASPARREVPPNPPPVLPSQELLIPKPLARAALEFVGADPEAETVWALAINDPDRSPNERKDLIEDLNEDGFPDPKHITADDLPLILSRLDLIEEFAPDSMDEVNAAAFAEAYKDLVNMLIKLGQ
jgi:hypothetical protein